MTTTRLRSAPGLQEKPMGSIEFADYLTKGQVDILLHNTPHSPGGLPKLAFLFMWRAGLRISEVLNLRMSDIFDDRIEDDSDGRRVYFIKVRQGKGGKDRVVPMHPELAVQFIGFLEYAGKNANDLIFESPRKKDGLKTGLAYDASTVWRWLKKAQQNCELASFPTSPHTLRHSFARHQLMQGIPIHLVSLWLGHANLRTTIDTYLQLVPDPDNLIFQVA